VKEHGGGIDAARFDALTRWAQSVLDDAAAGVAPDPGAGRWSGSRPHILLTMAASTLLGLDDRPCLLEGYGYLPATVAREIAERGGTLRRLLTDPVTGVVLGVDGHTYDAATALADSARLVPWRGLLPGPAPRSTPQDGDDDPPGNDGFASGPGPSGGPRPSGAPPRGACGDPARQPGRSDYRPSRALERLVRARYRTCTVPGCMRPSVRCDLDHMLRWPDGPTCACNLQPLCRRHHRMKHSGGIRVRRLRDGTIEWTIRTGHVFSTRPPPALPAPSLARPRTSDSVDVDPQPPLPPGYDAARWGARALRETVRALVEPATRKTAHAPEPHDDLGPPPF
ncbi:MAG: HNH endonuclease signature motif containing protein, partial [Actinomycetota bacterium]